MKRFIEEKIAVKCETKEELKEFLERCEKEGLEWITGVKATKLTPTLGEPVSIAICCGYLNKKGKELSWDFLERIDWKVIPYKEYCDTYKYKVGDIVETKFGKGEIKDIEEGNAPYLVYHYDWNRGHNNCLQYTGDHCWLFKEEDIKLSTEPTQEQITITRHGGHKVVAKYGEKVGVAKCNPEDEFNFEVGAKLALERLFETPSTVKEVSRKAKVGEYIKIKWPFGTSDEYKIGDIFKVRKVADYYGVYVFEHDMYISNLEYVVLEDYKPTETFKPHLRGIGQDYGYIGEEVEFTDVLFKELYVGDIVELCDVRNWEMVGKYFVCKQDGKGFVMSVKDSKFTNGISINLGQWLIKKVKSYKDLKHGEKIDSIRVVLKDEAK